MHTSIHRTGLFALVAGVGLLSALPQPVNAQQNETTSKSPRKVTTVKVQKKQTASKSRPQAAKVVRIYGNSSRTVTLDVRNAPLRDTIQQLFLQTKNDYILDPNVTGTVTMKVTNMPFEQALRLLVQSSNTPISLQRVAGVYEVKAGRSRTIQTPVYTAATPPVETTPVVPEPPVRADGGLVGSPQAGFAPGAGYGFPAGSNTTYGISGNGYGYVGGPVIGSPGFGGPNFGAPFGGPAVNFAPGFGAGFGNGYGGFGYPYIIQTTSPGFYPLGGFYLNP
jgi:hypothetical protein